MPVTLGESLKPGETLSSRDNRFSVWANCTGFNRKSSESHSPYRTDFKISTQYDREAAAGNFRLAKLSREKNSSQVSKIKSMSANSLSKSTTHMETYGDITQRIRTKIRQPDDFKEVFEFYGIPTPDGTSTMLALNQVGRVVRTVLGEDTAEYIIDKFTKLAYKATVSRYITWEQFRLEYVVYCCLLDLLFFDDRAVAEQAMKATVADIDEKTGVPPLILLMKKQPQENGLGSAASLWSSNYMDNFDKPLKAAAAASRPQTATQFGTITMGFPVETPPLSRPATGGLMFPKPCYSNPSSAHLFAGTPKGTPFQIPGYDGHLPQSTRNLRKKIHSDGIIEHSVPSNNLILTDKGQGALLGYTGHIPITPMESLAFRERKTGCDPLTTTGATYGETRLLL
jgi:hypothetical protein